MSIELLNRVDPFAGMRNAIRQIASEREDWAGIPMPLQDSPLVVESTYPKAKELMAIGRKEPRPDTDEEKNLKLRNKFYSHKARCDIYVIEHRDTGKVTYAPSPAVHHFTQELNTLGASYAWGLEQEGEAVRTLGTLLRHHAFKQYLLTGSFLELSDRSGVTYMFRKLKPAVAMTARKRGTDMQILCSLCLHPIAYYENSWAGAMCPTDDVIAHLMLMRGDEPMFWRRANQHAPHRPEAGL